MAFQFNPFTGNLDEVGGVQANVFVYEGTWNPNTNTPTLVDGTGTTGSVYWVSAAFSGTVSGLNNASMHNFQIGDLVLYNGTQWELTTPATGVVSVNGLQGVVTLTTDQIPEGTSNLYFTNTRAQTAAVVNSLGGSQTNQAPSVASVNTALGNKANTALSNLISTAINQILNFGTTIVGKLQTNNETTIASTDLVVASGNTTHIGSNSGKVTVESGSAPINGASGIVAIVSGPGGNTGAVNLTTANSTGSSGNLSGGINLQTGNSSVTDGTGVTGDVTLSTGNVGTGIGRSGIINLETGDNNGTGSTGDIDLQTGTPNDPAGASGDINLITAGGVVTGDILLETGSSASFGSFAGQTGNINIRTGDGATSDTAITTGGIALLTGTIIEPTSTTDTGEIDITTGGNIGLGVTGNINISTGNVNNGASSSNAGDIIIEPGVVQNGGTGGSGNIQLYCAPVGAQGVIALTALYVILPQGASDPTGSTFSPLAGGEAYRNTSSGDFRYYNGTSWTSLGSSTFKKEQFTLSPTNITNGYIDLLNVAKTDSINFVFNGLTSTQGTDYTVSYTGGAGGKTRVTFSAHSPTLVSGNIVTIQYSY